MTNATYSTVFGGCVWSLATHDLGSDQYSLDLSASGPRISGGEDIHVYVADQNGGNVWEVAPNEYLVNPGPFVFNFYMDPGQYPTKVNVVFQGASVFADAAWYGPTSVPGTGGDSGDSGDSAVRSPLTATRARFLR